MLNCRSCCSVSLMWLWQMVTNSCGLPQWAISQRWVSVRCKVAPLLKRKCPQSHCEHFRKFPLSLYRRILRIVLYGLVLLLRQLLLWFGKFRSYVVFGFSLP